MVHFINCIHNIFDSTCIYWRLTRLCDPTLIKLPQPPSGASQPANMSMNSYYPLSIKEELLQRFAGKLLKNVAGPAAVLDLSKLKTIVLGCWKL